MFDLINATQCLEALREKAGIKYSKSYFSQMVKEGKIPFHHKPDSPKKFYKYSEVLDAIEASKDPTRDAQREANAKKREKDECATLLDVVGTYKSSADMTQEEIEAERIAAKKAKEEAEAAKKEALDVGVEDVGVWKSSLPEGITQAEAKAEKEYWLGRKAELEFKKMNKELISVDEVEREAFETAKSVRDAFLALPARLAPILAADSDQFSVQNKLAIEINKALEVLSNE